MAIVNSIKKAFPGFGAPSNCFAAVTATTIAANAVTATATLAGGPGFLNYGRVRMKASNVDGGHALTSIVVTATDGVTTINLAVIAIASGVNGQGYDFNIPLCSDLNLTSVVAVVTGAAGISTLTVDLEVFGE